MITSRIMTITKMTPAAPCKKMPLLTTIILATLTTMLKMAVTLGPVVVVVVAAPGSSSFLGPSKSW